MRARPAPDGLSWSTSRGPNQDMLAEVKAQSSVNLWTLRIAVATLVVAVAGVFVTLLSR